MGTFHMTWKVEYYEVTEKDAFVFIGRTFVDIQYHLVTKINDFL